ncbi:MAG TPA: exonuclease domain-containing protein [Solirubrobacterales bacterium]
MAPAEAASVRAYRDAPVPARGTPWREVTFSVIDFETTGLDPSRDEIISFAGVTVSGGRVSLADSSYELVRPRRMPAPETIRIHGLRESDLAEAPSVLELRDGLLEILTARAVVAHVAAVERGFLEAALSTFGLELRNPVVDTAALDLELRRLRGLPQSEAEPVGLSNLAHSLGLPVHRPHHADGDALTTAQAFIALATHLEAFGVGTLGQLERLSAPRRERASLPAALRGLLARFGRR